MTVSTQTPPQLPLDSDTTLPLAAHDAAWTHHGGRILVGAPVGQRVVHCDSDGADVPTGGRDQRKGRHTHAPGGVTMRA